MSAFEKALREAAGKFKSFLDAVNAHLRNAFDRGATDVRISYNVVREGPLCLMIEDNGRALTRDQFVDITNPSPDPRNPYEILALTGTHHAGMLTVNNAGTTRTVNFTEYDESWKGVCPRVVERDGSLSKANVAIQFQFLNTGAGVDVRQDRTAARLIKRLPAMLTPREAGMVTVVDERGTSARLVVESRIKKRGDYVVWVSKIKIAFDQQPAPVVLKYGGVRVPLITIWNTLEPKGTEHPRVTIPVYLGFSWVSGTVEITRKDGATEFPDPLDNFPEAQYANGFVRELMDTLVETNVVGDIFDGIFAAGRSILNTIVPRDRPITFHDETFVLRQGTGGAFEQVRFAPETSGINHPQTAIRVNIFQSLFQLDNRSEATRERILWAVADALHERHKLTGSVSDSYLDLREAIAKANAS